MVQVAQLVTPQSVQAAPMIPYPTSHILGVLISASQVSILATSLQAAQALVAVNPNPLAQVRHSSAVKQSKQLSPQAVQTLPVK